MLTIQFDKKWAADRGFVHYDFNDPVLPDSLLESFDVIVIDPPFITSEVWMKYAATAHKLIKKTDGKYILTTILENAPLLNEQFGASPTVSISLELFYITYVL